MPFTVANEEARLKKRGSNNDPDNDTVNNNGALPKKPTPRHTRNIVKVFLYSLFEKALSATHYGLRCFLFVFMKNRAEIFYSIFLI